MKTKLMHAKLSGKMNTLMITTICLIGGLFPAACSMLQSKETRIIDAIQAGDNTAAEQLIQKTENIDYINESGMFALLEAASVGNLELVKLLVNKGADINLSSKSKTTPLMKAVDKGHKPIVVYLIEQKADLSLTNLQKYSALHIAVERGRRDIIELLLSKGAPTEYTEKGSISLLVPAINNNNIDIVRFLLNKRVNPNATNTEMMPPLLVAVQSPNLEMVKLLLEKGASIHAEDAFGCDSLLIIGGLDKLLIIEKIYKKLNAPIENVDIDETDSGDKKKKIYFRELVSRMEQISEERIEIEKKLELFNDTSDYSFLAVEASDQTIQSTADQLKENYLGVIKLLFSKGVDINRTDKRKRSALILQSGQKNTDILALFSKNGFLMEPKVEHQLTLVIQKASEIQNELTQIFIDAKADMNLQDQYGQSALMAACSNGNLDFVAILLKNGAKVNQANNDGWTPLINAVSIEHYDIVELLLQQGANVNAANNFGETPLLKAVYRNNEKIVKLLIEYGADFHRKNKTGDSPLSVAEKKGYANILAALVDKK